jgi:N-acyl-D-aspartate/D-glutamate deacylase
MLDWLVEGATVVDGTGTAPFAADVGVRDGRIVGIGRLTEAAHRRVRAGGAWLTPGFIDIHTHYDGRASWHATFSPGIWHGVSTLVMGNCSVGFAPLAPGPKARATADLITLMEGVEDIPAVALAEGVRFDWRRFPQYMDALDAMPHSLDFCVQVPHDPLRMAVTGERAQGAAGGDGTPIPPLEDILLARIEPIAARMFPLGVKPDHEPPVGQRYCLRARQPGVTALEALVDHLAEGDGSNLSCFPIFSDDDGSLEVVREMLDHPGALRGLSDVGAHVGTVCDASCSAFVLTHWVRDRVRRCMPVERAVQLLTSRNARHIGLDDRGAITAERPGRLVRFGADAAR